MKKYFLSFGLLLTVALTTTVFNSCGDNDDNDKKDKNAKLSKLDISNSTALFIAPSNSSLKSAGQTNRLFKVTNNGVVKEVSYLDEAGNPITETFVPEMLYVIANSDYFVAKLNYSTYLLRKSDGAVFALNASLGDIWNSGNRTGGYVNADFIVQDANKNLYFINEMKGRVYKLDVSNPNSITSSPVTPDTESAWDFTVSAKGDVFYSTNNVFRVAKSKGGLYNIPYNGITLNSWTGLDGKIRYAIGSNTLYTVNIEENGNASIDEKTLNFQLGPLYHPVHMLRFNNRVILLMESLSYPIQEVENELNAPRPIGLSYNISTIKKATNSEKYYYLSGLNSSQQPFLIKVNPANDAVTELLNIGDYDIYAMTVSKDDELIFNALRMSDGVKIIGKISSTGNLQIIDTQINSEVTVLERIQ